MITYDVHSPTNQQAMCSYKHNNLRKSCHIPHVSILCCGIMLLYTAKSSGLQLSFPIPSLSLLSSCKTTFGHNRWKLFKGWMLFLRPHLTFQQGQQLLFETILSPLLFGTSMVAAFLSSPAMPVLSTLCKLILLNQYFWLSGPVFSLYKVFQTMAHKPNLVCCPFLLYCLWLLSCYSGQSWADLKGVNRASMPKICYLVLPKSARPSIQLSLQVTSCKHL